MTAPVTARLVDIDALSYEPSSPYVWRFWLAILGPTSTLLWQRLVERIDESSGPVDVDVTEMCAELGVLREEVVQRTLQRLAKFRFVSIGDDGVLEVRAAALPLPLRLAGRLPERLRRRHDAFVAGPAMVWPAVDEELWEDHGYRGLG